MRPLGGSYSLKTQDGPLCCENGLGTQTVELDHIGCIVKFILHGCSGWMQGLGRGQATAAEVANPSQRDFVNALGYLRTTCSRSDSRICSETRHVLRR